jgi:ELWxxDGT repeat protein
MTVEALEGRDLMAAALVADFNPGAYGSDRASLTDLATSGGKLYFEADYQHRYQLFVSDGTAAGTQRLTSFHLGEPRSGPRDGSEFYDFIDAGNGILFFRYYDGTAQTYTEWKTDGTAAGTAPTAALPAGAAFRPGLNPMIGVAGTVYFTASDATGQISLWKTDGTAAGTKLLKPLVSGPRAFVRSMTAFGGAVYFIASDGHVFQPWRMDGTPAGTVPILQDLKDSAGHPSHLTGSFYAIGSQLYLEGGTGDGTSALYKLDASGNNATSLTGSPADGYLTDPVALGNVFYFLRASPGTPFSLWRSDGTPAGTTEVKAISDGSGGVTVPNSEPVRVGNAILFMTSGANGLSLWRSDGTAAGTSVIARPTAPDGPGPSNNTGYVVAPVPPSSAHPGGQYFVIMIGPQDLSLRPFVTDGTAAGTARADLSPFTDIDLIVRNSDHPSPSVTMPIVLNGSLYFTAVSAPNEMQLWKYDPNTTPVPPPAPPKVKSVTVNDGAAQRSMVKTVTVTFDRAVNLAAGAFDLRDAAGHSIGLTLTGLSAAGGPTTVRLAFTGNGLIGGSLADGNYRLTVHADKVTDRATGTKLDGDGDGLSGGDRVADFFRLFGDLNADRFVSPAERTAVKQAVGKRAGQPGYDAALDFNSDGVIDATDDRQVVIRYQKRLPA